MNYAKSDPIENIKQHTDKLLDNLELIRILYGKRMLKNKNIDEKRFWQLEEYASLYHDIGKVYTPFQNILREKLKLPTLPTTFNYSSIKHEQLSPLFIPSEELELTKDEKKLVYQAIFYHHVRKKEVIEPELVKDIIEQDFKPRLQDIATELNIKVEKQPKGNYLKYISNRINSDSHLYIESCLLEGILQRLDYSSSANSLVEDPTKERLDYLVEDYMKNKKFHINELQKFCKENKEKNIIVVAPTGMGKTEAALLWGENNKLFFTLPIRVSINAIYDRILEQIGYKHIGLLHSTAQDYISEKEEFMNLYSTYEQAKNLEQKVTTCTIDQIFPFVFKYKGYKRIYATLSYSKIIIDEIQAYSPEIVAILLKGIQMIDAIGGKFMIMTATLPEIYKEVLTKTKIDFVYKDDFKITMKRHKISIVTKNIIDDSKIIQAQSKEKKVLVIVNTINKAIELYRKLKEEDTGEIYLFHSRFTLKDKNEKEQKIKAFAKNKKQKGIWITTQLVEASLDIDFDVLYTEMSTLDSLFQRFGRCYRKREYTEKEPNIYIYTKEVSGIPYIYDRDIHEKSMKLLQDYNKQLLEEETKRDLVKVLYSRENLKNTKYLECFDTSLKILDNLLDDNINKTQAQKLLRNIENVTVIPKKLYDQNLDIFIEFDKCQDKEKKHELKKQITKLTTTISKNQEYFVKDKLFSIPYIEEMKGIDLKYNSEEGLLLEKDIEYELEERNC